MAAMNQQANRKTDGRDTDSQEMIAEALHSLHNDKDELDRELAVMTLGEYTSNAAMDGIVYALNDPEAIVRDQAVVQISKWEDPKERQHMFLSALNNKHSDTVMLALESILEVDNPLLIKRLKVLSKYNNEEIREAAKLAIQLSN